jgi:hypothetical protein
MNVFPQLQWIYIKRWVADEQWYREDPYGRVLAEYTPQIMENIMEINAVLSVLKRKGSVVSDN